MAKREQAPSQEPAAISLCPDSHGVLPSDTGANDGMSRQREQLARLIGQLLAHEWLRQQRSATEPKE